MRLSHPALAVLALAPSMLMAQTADGESYPAKPIRFIVPFPAGGGSDIMARILSHKMTGQLGQNIVIDNRGGAGGNIGAEIAAKAAPDGYTMLIGNFSHAANMALYPKLSYDLLKDFAAVSQLASSPNLLVLHPSVPAKSVKELITLAKSAPASLNMASSGNGSSAHLAGELFQMMTDVKFTHVAYRGGAPAVTALLAGNVSLIFASMPSALPHIQSGRLRALAVSSARRSEAAPNIPTISEAGVSGYESFTWHNLLMPAGTSKAIISRLNAESRRAIDSADTRERLAASGLEPMTSTPEELTAFLKSEVAKWRKLVKVAGIRAE